MLWNEQKLTTCTVILKWNECNRIILCVVFYIKTNIKYHAKSEVKKHKNTYWLTKYLKQIKLLQKKNYRMFTNSKVHDLIYTHKRKCAQHLFSMYDEWGERNPITTSTNSRKKKSQIYATKCKPYALHFS